MNCGIMQEEPVGLQWIEIRGVGRKGFPGEAKLGPGLQGGWDPPKPKRTHKQSVGLNGVILEGTRRPWDACMKRREIKWQRLKTEADKHDKHWIPGGTI